MRSSYNLNSSIGSPRICLDSPVLCFGGHFEFLIRERSGSAKSGTEITEIPSSHHAVSLMSAHALKLM